MNLQRAGAAAVADEQSVARADRVALAQESLRLERSEMAQLIEIDGAVAVVHQEHRRIVGFGIIDGVMAVDPEPVPTRFDEERLALLRYGDGHEGGSGRGDDRADHRAVAVDEHEVRQRYGWVGRNGADREKRTGRRHECDSSGYDEKRLPHICSFLGPSPAALRWPPARSQALVRPSLE